METKEKIIRPAGAFTSYEEYAKQFPEKKMKITQRTDIFIDDVNPERIRAYGLPTGSTYVLSIDSYCFLFFQNFTELCTFAHAITDKVAEIAPERMAENDAS
jgi:hypothetical protein